MSALGGTITVSALFGQLAVATAMIGPMGIIITLGLLQVRRRMAALPQSIQGRMARDLRERRTATTRQIREAERRVLAAVDRAGAATRDRHQKMLTALDRSDRGVVSSVERSGREVMRLQREQTHQVEALLQLFSGFAPRAPMPSSGGWALNPTGLLEVLSLVERHRPKTVLELGSGVSSVWLAYALEKTGGRLVTIDHEQKYAERTSSLLSLHGLDQIAEVRIAALRPMSVAGADFRWYDPDAFADLSEVDLLVVDGPPGATGPVARYPALPMLEEKLAASATVVLDDVQRPDEQETIRRWTETISGLSQEHGVFGHHAVLSYASASS
jgi:predicted O-methyltransferase YrrM